MPLSGNFKNEFYNPATGRKTFTKGTASLDGDLEYNDDASIKHTPAYLRQSSYNKIISALEQALVIYPGINFTEYKFGTLAEATGPKLKFTWFNPQTNSTTEHVTDMVALISAWEDAWYNGFNTISTIRSSFLSTVAFGLQWKPQS
jgi:hypothetical protein